MAIKRKKLLIGAIILALLVAGGVTWWALADSEPEKVEPPVVIPAERVLFQVVPPGKERRGGLYARWVSGEEQLAPASEMFTGLADQGQKPLMATEGGWPMLVGRLPGTVNGMGFDFFQPQAGSVKDGNINIPVKFIRWSGEFTESPPPRAVYFTVDLPALPPGKYRATVTFPNFEYAGDKSKITVSPKTRIWRFVEGLTCEFEVKPAKK